MVLKLLLFFNLLLLLSCVSRKPYIADPLHYHSRISKSCAYKPKYSVSQRRTFYPYDVADSVQLVSFYDRPMNFPITKDTLIKDSLVEVKTLLQTDQDTLTDILYNDFYKNYNPGNIGTIKQCFFPRNAVLFYKDGKVKEFILICFHCGNVRLSS